MVWIEMVATKLATCDPTDRMNEVGAVKIFKPVLIRVVGVGSTVEIVSRRIFPTFLVTSVLGSIQYAYNGELKREHLRGNPLR